MSNKAKDALDDIRNKLFERKKEEVEKQAQEEVNKTLENTVYDIVQDPLNKNRSFLSVKIKYDLVTKQAQVVDIKPFENKTAGLAIIMDKESRKYLFEKK